MRFFGCFGFLDRLRRYDHEFRAPEENRGHDEVAQRHGDAVQLGLFTATRDPIAEELAGLDLAHLTPIEALNLLAKWQRAVGAEATWSARSAGGPSDRRGAP